MSKIKLILEVVCEDEDMARRVQTEYLPHLDELIVLDGIETVKATWLAEAEPRMVRRDG